MPHMNFDAFRDWALAASTRAARRWEDPTADEVPLAYAQDLYGDLHEIVIPPVYSEREGGHIGWMTQLLPVEVANRSLSKLCLRISAWSGDADKYKDLSADPDRTEFLLNVVAERGRRELWHARIERDNSGLPSLGAWRQYPARTTQGRLFRLIDDALRPGPKKKGRTMPAANMVLGPYDVPGITSPTFGEMLAARLNGLPRMTWSAPTKPLSDLDSLIMSSSLSAISSLPSTVWTTTCRERWGHSNGTVTEKSLDRRLATDRTSSMASSTKGGSTSIRHCGRTARSSASWDLQGPRASSRRPSSAR